ncbi:MAG TPA: glycosyltransferase family 2 protein [Aeromicrobium sp.]|nr:glycosyltransferase family 2 protein [Aeromicrobium sp.]
MSESAPVRHWLDDPPTVAAVLVSHNGSTWLPKVLQSFSSMYHSPDVWRAVDVHSVDGSRQLVTQSFGAERVIHAPRRTGFGAAVRMAVEAMPRTDWLWLLHDDAAVLPGTLSGLLDVATSADDIAAVGPKIREWPSLRRLLEVGVTVTRTGTRETGLESGEPDAGQYDRPRDVLAVSTAGILIRRDVWDELDGLDPHLPLFYDDIDFGWRVWKAGYRIRTAPAGVIFHAEGARRGSRHQVRGDLPDWEQRRAALWTQLANASRLSFWWQYVRLFIGTLARCLGHLALKEAEAAGDELMALRSVYLHPLRLLRARRARRAVNRVGSKAVRPLLAPLWLPYRHAYDATREAIAAIVRPETVVTVGRRSTTLDQTPEEVEDLDDGPSWLRQRPWFAVVCVLTLAALVAGRDLLGGIAQGVQGGALPRSPETSAGWWDLLVGTERPVGLVDAVPALFALPLAVLSTPFWTRPDLIVTVVMLFAVPLAALSAHRLGRLITPHRVPRTIWAVGYAMMVAGVGAVPQGRIGTVVALVVAPIIANTAWQLVEDPHWRIALRLGIAVAVATAFAPVSLLIAAGGFVLVLFLEGRWVSRHLMLAGLTVLLLIGPWLVRAGVPWRWWWEAGEPVEGPQSLIDVVMGRAGGIQAPWWLSIPVLVLGCLALVPTRSRFAVQPCWWFGLWCLAIACSGHVLNFAGPSGRVDLDPWVGVPAVLWLASLATAALIAAPSLADQSRRVVTIVTVAAVVLPVGVGLWWVGRGAADPLTDANLAEVPTFLTERPGRTLVIDGTDTTPVRYRAVAGRGGYLGQEAFRPNADHSRDLTRAVQHLLGTASNTDVSALQEAGIGEIYLPRADQAPELARRIDAAPNLEQTGSDSPDSRAWVLVDDPELDSTPVSWWRSLISWIQIVIWGVAVVLTAPVRRRVQEVVADHELDDEPTPIAVRLPEDSAGVGR